MCIGRSAICSIASSGTAHCGGFSPMMPRYGMALPQAIESDGEFPETMEIALCHDEHLEIISVYTRHHIAHRNIDRHRTSDVSCLSLHTGCGNAWRFPTEQPQPVRDRHLIDAGDFAGAQSELIGAMGRLEQKYMGK